jgi:hypothetical protein
VLSKNKASNEAERRELNVLKMKSPVFMSVVFVS